MAGVDYPSALPMFVDRSRIFPNYNGHTPIAIVIHRTAGFNTLEELARYFATNPDMDTSHFGMGLDGRVGQFVLLSDAATANCCTSTGHDPFWPANINLNFITVSIELVCPDVHNATPPTPAQLQASFELVTWLCRYFTFPSSRLMTHASIDPVNRGHCPGNYPMSDLRAYVARQLGEQPVKLSIAGEVGTFSVPNQFRAGKSAYECVPECVAVCFYAGPPDGQPRGTPDAVYNLADQLYIRETGSDLASNTSGFSTAQEYDALQVEGYKRIADYSQAVGMSYLPLPIDASTQHANDIQHVKDALSRGCMVLICGTETGMWDVELGRVPYDWTPSGNHCITATGIAKSGNLIVRDTANVLHLGPREYDVNRLFLVSGTAIVPSWLGGNMGVPNGWKPVGDTLIAPNNVAVVRGFRDWILNHPWDADNWPLDVEKSYSPLEESNPALGDGTAQMFRKCRLCWQKSANKVYESWTGQELAWYQQQYGSLHAQISDLQATVKQLQATVNPQADPRLALAAQALTNVVTAVQQGNANLQEGLKTVQQILTNPPQSVPTKP